MRELGENIKHLKEEMQTKLDRRYGTGLYGMEFHLLRQVVEDHVKVGNHTTLDISQFDGFNAHFKHAQGSTSQQQVSGMLDTVEVMDVKTGRGYE